MIDKLINIIFSWEKLRLAIFDEVHMYDELDKRIKEYKNEKPANKYWKEGDTWYGWAYNKEFNRYYFNDYGTKSFFELLNISGEV
jgi:hypothetical protein